MTRSARCAICGEDCTYNVQTFTWTHDRQGHDHGPAPIDIVYPNKVSISKAKGRKRNG